MCLRREGRRLQILLGCSKVKYYFILEGCDLHELFVFGKGNQLEFFKTICRSINYTSSNLIIDSDVMTNY